MDAERKGTGLSATIRDRRLWSYFRHHDRAAVLTLATMLAGTAAAMLLPFFLGRLIDRVLASGRKSVLVWGACLYILLESLRYGLDWLHTRQLGKLALGITHRLMADVIHHLGRVSLSYFDNTGLGTVLTYLTSDVPVLSEGLTRGLLGLVRDVLVLIAAAGFLLALDPGFGAFTLVAALAVAVPGVAVRRSALRWVREAAEAVAQASSVLEENIAGRATIRAFGMQPKRQRLFELANERLLSSGLESLRMRALCDGAAAVAGALSMTLVLGYGGAQISRGAISVGVLFSFLQYAPCVVGAVRGMFEKWRLILSGLVAAERILGVLDQSEGLTPLPRERSERVNETGLVASGLTFGYCAKTQVLRNVSVRFQPGERVALIGRSGAGKSTLAKVLARLFDPWEGAVHLDGIDLRTRLPGELRRKICLVTQETFLFSGSLLENIRLGDTSIERTDVIEACHSVGANDLAESLADDPDAAIGNGVSPISSGQRQLVGLLRAFVRKPPIVILDEPTASLDRATEGRVLRALESVLRGRTSVIIAHRLATVRQADRILVIEKGRIVDQGTPKELSRREGFYRSLAELQGALSCGGAEPGIDAAPQNR